MRLISPEALARYMEFRGYTVRALAKSVGCSPATIGHLRTGERNYCRPDWAKSIERYLQAPPGSLFVPELSTVSRETGRKAS